MFERNGRGFFGVGKRHGAVSDLAVLSMVTSDCRIRAGDFLGNGRFWGKCAIGKCAIGKWAIGKWAIGKWAIGKWAIGQIHHAIRLILPVIRNSDTAEIRRRQCRVPTDVGGDV